MDRITKQQTVPSSWQHWGVATVALLIGLMSFHLLFGIEVLSAGAPVWRNPPNDLGQMLAGFEAVMQDPWRFPPTVSTRLVAPVPVSILFTDSIPWLVLGIKAAGLGASDVNPLAVFLLLSHALQSLGMVAVLRAWGVRRPTVLLTGAILGLLVPTWLVRQFGHVALSGHWVLLFALALAVGASRDRLSPGRMVSFAALGALAAGIHPYHLVSVGACCGVAVLAEIMQQRPRSFACNVATIPLFAGAIGLAAYVLGYGYGGNASLGGSVMGLLSMNLVGPALPQASALAGHVQQGAWFTGTIDPTGAQAFEGYQYLGAGALLLIIAALFLLARRRHPAPGMRRYGPLLAACLVLTAWAVGPKVYAGPWLLLDLPRPDGTVGEVLGIFRAHGRFFWLVGYTALAGALVVLDRQASRSTALTLGVAAIALQIADTSVLRGAVGAVYQASSPLPIPAALADAPQVAGRDWLMLPTLYCTHDEDDRQVIRQLSLVAIRNGGSSNSAPTARTFGLDCNDTVRTAEARPRAMLVLLRRSLALGDQLRLASTRTCYRMQFGYVCGEGLEQVPDLQAADPIEDIPRLADWNETFRLDHDARPAILAGGWSAPGTQGTWTEGTDARVMFVPPPGSGILRIEAIGYVPPALAKEGGQRVEVTADGILIASWHVHGSSWSHYEAALPATMLQAGRPVTIRFRVPGALSPSSTGSMDTRVLGIAVRAISLAPPSGLAP